LQLAWTRRLAVTLGHEWPATLAVFTAFFLGMTAGAWGLSGRIRRSPRPWLWLAALEVGIASWALLSVPWLRWLGESSAAWTGAEPGWARFAAVATMVTAAGLLPGTVAMGATFAAFERTWALRATGPQAPSGHVGALYAWNTAGAVAGVVAALAWLQPALGLAGATVAAAAGNVLAAIAGGWNGANGANGVHRADGTTRADGAQEGRWVAWLGLGGFLGMGLEVVGIRVLAPVLGGTVYSQAAVLGVWLAGTAAGATPWVRGWMGRGQGLGLALGWVAAAAWAAWAMELGSAWVTTGEAHTGFWQGWWREWALVAAVAGPASAVSSAWFVRGMERAMASGMESGRAVGWNLFGATLAPCVWGTLAVPLLGERGAWAALTGAGAALGWVLGVRSAEGDRGLSRSRWWMTGLAMALMAAGGIPGLDLSSPPPGARRVRRLPGMSDTVEVWEWPDRSRTLAVNRRMTMGGTATAAAAARHAHVPLLLHPGPQTALFLGLGTGISFAAAGAHPGLRADGVELVPEVVRVLGEFAPENTLGPGLRVVTADARRFVRAPGPTYDVIVSDLFHPERDGAAWLYTEEHFRAMRSRLADGGVACQWLPWFQLDARSRASVAAAWLKVFPGSEAWLLRWTTLDTPVVGLVHGAGRVTPRDWGARVGTGPLREALRRSGLTDGWQLWGCWAGPATSLARGVAEPNTDDRPIVLWTAARGMDAARSGSRAGLLEWLGEVQRERPPWAMASGNDGDRWARMRRARDAYLTGLDAVVSGRPGAGEQALWESVTTSADFPTGYSHLLGEAMSAASNDPARAREILVRLVQERPSVPVAGEVLRRMDARPGP
jgi:spermidine synthase